MEKCNRLFVVISFLMIPLQVLSQEFPKETNNEIIEDDVINWEKFPEFKVPFPVVYHGPVPNDGLAHPLRHGFSHIQGNISDYKEYIPKKNFLYLWTGISGADGWASKEKQPWSLIKSPWNNDIEGYRKAWWNRLSHINNVWLSHSIDSIDGIIVDIEQSFHTDLEILKLRKSKLIPLKIRLLSKSKFIEKYKRDMALLYNEPFKLIKDSLSNDIKLSSYSETPIRRKFWEIKNQSWDLWTSNLKNVDFLVKDEFGELNSDFYKNHDFISPTGYFFYDPKNNSYGKNYLAYLLFQIDVNRYWSKKDQMLFVWMNYHYSASSKMAPISKEMAQCSAIFPLISGVGIYNWRMNNNSFDVYEDFVLGLYRMSKYNDFFDGNETYLKSSNPVEDFNKKSAIWRGVVNNGKILIAAHNPFAESNVIFFLDIEYKGKIYTIELTGSEVLLKELVL